MKRASVLVLLAVAAQAQMQRAKFASGYMYSYYVPQSASTPWRPAWSPDGKEIAFGMSGSLWKIRPGDTTAYELTANSTYDSSPAWSPDGRFIVFTGEDSSGVNLMLLNVATLESTPLTRGSDIYADPVFSPDGRTIAFVRGIQSPTRVTRVGPDAVNDQDGQPPKGYHVYTLPFENGKTGRPTQITAENSYGRARLYFSPFDDQSLAHHVDVGGGAPASIGAFQETYQEGIIIPPVKLVKAGVVDDDIFQFFLANIRSKHETAGDLRTQLAANKLGHRRIAALVDKYGARTLDDYIDELVEYTGRRTRHEIGKLPQGTFQAEGFLDDDGITDEPIRLCAKITIENENVVIDLTGTSAQRRAPMNSTYAQTFSSCAYFLKCLMDPDLPVNAGYYQAIRVIAPEGTVANAVHPAAVVGGWEVSIRWVDIFFRAISDALPDRICAGGKAMQCHAGFGGFDPRPHRAAGSYYCFLETLAGGYGGRLGKDGPDAVQTYSQNTENAPVEETELNYPVRITRYELVPDSDGPGEYRGGLGLRRDYLFPDHEPTFTILADRLKFPPLGLFGGASGKLAYYALIDKDGLENPLRSKTTFTVPEGCTVTMQTCGGGGYGPSLHRDPRRVLKDVIEGKVSISRAREIYRVAIDPDLQQVDEERTAGLRAGQNGLA